MTVNSSMATHLRSLKREVQTMCKEREHKKPSLNAVLRNLRVDMPVLEKMSLFFRNNWIKVTRVQNCCGHPGEPGC